MSRWIALQLLVFVFTFFSPAMSQDASIREATADAIKLGPHGGEMHQLDGCRCEVVLTPKGLRVYLFAENGEPLPARYVRGRISFEDGEQSRTYRYDLYPKGLKGNSLYLPLNRSMSVKQSKSFDITLHGLPSRERRIVTVAQEFKTSIPK